MKQLNKKRIESLENVLMAKRRRPRSAMVCYDPAISNFKIDSLGIDADIVLILPDNGKRCSGEKCIPKGSYTVSYHY